MAGLRASSATDALADLRPEAEQPPPRRYDLEQLTYVCETNATHVAVGETRGNPHTEVFGSCTHAEFVAGCFQKLVRDRFGPRVLSEVLAEIAGTSA